MARLKEAYKKVIIPELMKKLNLKNIHQVPKLEKIVINMGVSDARENPKAMDIASAELAALTGQKPLLRRAKKSISAFKLREGMAIGLKVTLRGNRMYEFFDRLVSISIPKIRDFRGLEPSKFDGSGNYNLGLTEQYIFPEINLDKSDKSRGMNITIVTTAKNDEYAKEFLSMMGMPFRKAEQTSKKAIEQK
ncbi:MAG: 50S ribosomal protein L5 [Elusimicrobiota bacterium]|nr:50S ribosomal protein L5 [Elusimicrobiota bacterium]